MTTKALNTATNWNDKGRETNMFESEGLESRLQAPIATQGEVEIGHKNVQDFLKGFSLFSNGKQSPTTVMKSGTRHIQDSERGERTKSSLVPILQ